MVSEPPDAPEAGSAPARPPAGDQSRAAGGEWGAGKAMEVLAIAFVFPLAIYVGFLLGGWLGTRFDAPGWGRLIGGVVGAAAGFWELYRFVRRLSRS